MNRPTWDFSAVDSSEALLAVIREMKAHLDSMEERPHMHGTPREVESVYLLTLRYYWIAHGLEWKGEDTEQWTERYRQMSRLRYGVSTCGLCGPPSSEMPMGLEELVTHLKELRTLQNEMMLVRLKAWKEEIGRAARETAKETEEVEDT